MNGRRDRTGEMIEDDQDEEYDVGHRCARGWIDRDAARPCLVCRPWLAERRPPTPKELAAARKASP